MRFLLDHDVPDEVGQLLRHWEHDAQLLRDRLPVTTADDAILRYAQQEARILISCNRNHFLKLARELSAGQEPFAGLIILVRRRTRQAECARLLSLLRRAGEGGVKGNINVA